MINTVANHCRVSWNGRTFPVGGSGAYFRGKLSFLPVRPLHWALAGTVVASVSRNNSLSILRISKENQGK